MMAPEILILIGPRGCGKTTVGRLLARRLGRPFVDLDDRVLARFGEQTITEVWAAHGEAAWRQAETMVARDLLGDPRAGMVLAMGGGAPLVEGVAGEVRRAQQTDRARTVYLHCDPATLRSRIENELDDRPSLTGTGALDEIEAVLQRRLSSYRSLANIEVDGSGDDPDRIAGRIQLQLAATS